MDDKRLALLGDRDAQERMTQRGGLLPCWRCGEKAEIKRIHTGGKPIYAVSCKAHCCGACGCAHDTKANAIAYWNTRAPVLSAEELERLEGME